MKHVLWGAEQHISSDNAWDLKVLRQNVILTEVSVFFFTIFNIMGWWQLQIG
jgi:hypothetical protein